MKTTFNIPKLYQQVFGIQGVKIALPKLAGDIANTVAEVAQYAAGELANQTDYSKRLATTNNNAYRGIKTIPAPTAASVMSILGTPIYEQITLSVPAVVSNGAVTSKAYTYTFPDWPLFDITASWLIKKENVPGGIGTVKEMIQQDDFSITIRGFLINYASQDYPTQLMADLWSVINSKLSLGIASPVFNLLGIHNIIIDEASFPGVEGYMNMQPFELKCSSDFPILLQIKQGNAQKTITPGL